MLDYHFKSILGSAANESAAANAAAANAADMKLIGYEWVELLKSHYRSHVTTRTIPYYLLDINQEEYNFYLKENISIPAEFRDIADAYRWIEAQPQPAQRTPEWFAARNDKITASSAATALDENKYSSSDEYLIEKCTDHVFTDNKFCHHGKKYEPVATMLYEYMYDVTVKEFGLIGHPRFNYLGASPDGIVTPCRKHTMDFTPRFGRMLEIKVPYSRKMEFAGDVDGTICPHYYWVQVQCQLEACDLEKCDFWQVKLTEYDTIGEYLADSEPTIDAIKETADLFNGNNRFLRKGMVIELLPNDVVESPDFANAGPDVVFKSVYIYPPTLLYDNEQYMNWVGLTLANLPNTHPDYKFICVRYWRVERCHNETITRDREWFAKAQPKFCAFWDRVLYYRSHPVEFEAFHEEYKRRKLAEPPKRYGWKPRTNNPMTNPMTNPTTNPGQKPSPKPSNATKYQSQGVAMPSTKSIFDSDSE
jgi:putative phage-type endonuclease